MDLLKIILKVGLKANVVLSALLEVRDGAWIFTVSVTIIGERGRFCSKKEGAWRSNGSRKLSPITRAVGGNRYSPMESYFPQGSNTHLAGLSLGLRKESQLSRKVILFFFLIGK